MVPYSDQPGGALEIRNGLAHLIALFNAPRSHSPAPASLCPSWSPCSWVPNGHCVNSVTPVLVSHGSVKVGEGELEFSVAR